MSSTIWNNKKNILPFKCKVLDRLNKPGDVWLLIIIFTFSLSIAFNKARGYDMERENYLNDLRERTPNL